MKTLRNTFIVLSIVALALIVVPVASANTLTVIGSSIADTTSVTSNMGNLTVGGFYSAPGYVVGDMLTGVQIIFSGDGTTQFNATLLGFNLSGPNPTNGTVGTVQLNGFSNSTTLTLSGLTPPLVLSGTASAGATILSTTAPANSATYTSSVIDILGTNVTDNPASILPYETAGLLTYTLSGTASNNANTQDLTNLFSVASGGTTEAGASIEAIYTYDAPPTGTPEPGTLSLFGTGLLGLAGMLRRKFAK